MIYLDYSANTPADPAVLKRFVNTEQTFHGNPNSNHPAGLAAREELARVTDRIAARLGVAPAELIYTSGASEANNTAIKGIVPGASRHVGKHIISTALEHSSVGGCAVRIAAAGLRGRPAWTSGETAPLIWNICASFCERTRCSSPSLRGGQRTRHGAANAQEIADIVEQTTPTAASMWTRRRPWGRPSWCSPVWTQ